MRWRGALDHGQFGLGADQPPAGGLGNDRQGGVVQDREIFHDALAAPVLGNIGNAFCDGVGGGLDRHRVAVQEDCPGCWPFDAEDRPRDFRAAAADEPGHAHDLAGPDREVDIVELAMVRQSLEFKNRATQDCSRPFVEVSEFAADHEFDDFALRDVGGADRVHQGAITQDGQTIRDAEDFLQAMTDEHHGNALFLQPLDHVEETVDLCRGEGRSGLVQNQDFGFGDQGAGNFHELLLRDPQ
ncbi:hypothetical protein AAHB34_09040 [Paenarthrobacter ureafaciens]